MFSVSITLLSLLQLVGSLAEMVGGNCIHKVLVEKTQTPASDPSLSRTRLLDKYYPNPCFRRCIAQTIKLTSKQKPYERK